MLANYHTHTFRCLHAGSYQDEEYVLAALENGYGILGFSDHTPWPYKTDYVSPRVRMPLSQLPDYMQSIRALQKKYEGRIQILMGLECEYFPDYIDWLRGIAPQFDYLILGNHFHLTDEDGKPYYGRHADEQALADYTEMVCKGMQTGLFCCLAHPELPLAQYPEFDGHAKEMCHTICREAKALGLPLEFNLIGYRKRDTGKFAGLGYPYPEFWKIAAQYGCTAILGVDAHAPERLYHSEWRAEAEALLSSLNLRVLDTLPLAP